MSILIYRDLQIINGYVQLPPNKEQNKNQLLAEDALTNLQSTEIVRLTNGSGRQFGSRIGAQEILRLPGRPSDGWYDVDPIEEIV